jgi:hypothetical protein
MSTDFAVRAPRMVLVNMVTGEARTPQFNPAEFEEKLGATYADLQVPGLSHKVKHFINTENTAYSFELFYHCLDGSGAAGLKAILDDRKFLHALVHPWRSDGIKRGGAPRTLFIWPKLISLTCIVKTLTFKYTMFNQEGSPVAYTAKVELEEIRDVFVGMDDILNLGTQRADANGVIAVDGGEV